MLQLHYQRFDRNTLLAQCSYTTQYTFQHCGHWPLYHFLHSTHLIIFNTMPIQTLCSMYTFQHCAHSIILNSAQIVSFCVTLFSPSPSFQLNVMHSQLDHMTVHHFQQYWQEKLSFSFNHSEI